MAATHPFGREMRRLRQQRRLSLRRLGLLVNFTPGYLSKVEHGRRPSIALARLCDEVLVADGALIRLAGVTSEPAQPAQLPPAIRHYVLQEQQLRLENSLRLRHSPGPLVLVVSGPPGAGKSAVAVRAAHAVVDDYPDGILYADLRGEWPRAAQRRVEDVMSAFLTALGAPVRETPAIDAQVALYRSLLSPRRTLVVLDNVTRSAEVLPFLPGSPTSSVLVTSRNRLSQLTLTADVDRVTIMPLTVDDAIQLLSQIVGRDRVEAERAAFEELAARCGHLPVALRIAGERIVARPDRSTRCLLKEIAVDPMEALTTGDSIGVRDVFDLSYRRLDDASARLFRLLGLHPGTDLCTPAVAALAGVSCARADRLVERLVGAELMVSRGDRHHLHGLLARYAAERSGAEDTATDRNAAIDRLLIWYVTGAQAMSARPHPSTLSAPPLCHTAPEPTPCCSVDQPRNGEQWYAAETGNLTALARLARETGRSVFAHSIQESLIRFGERSSRAVAS